MAPKGRRLLVLFGTRPEAIKLFPVLARLAGDERFAVRVVATHQHRELLDGLLGPDAIRADHELAVMRPGQGPAETAARTLAGLDPVLAELSPEMLLVQGDTTSAFAGGLAAFYRGIPVAHVEAGLRSRDRCHPFPEEVHRRLLSVVADLHFAPRERDAEHLRAEGVESSRIHVTGNPVIDALRAIRARGLGGLERWVASEQLEGRRMLLVSAHRRESHDGPIAELCLGLRDLVERFPDLVVVFPVHANPAVRRAVTPILGGLKRVRLVEPLPYEAFAEAMARASLIVTDSGGVQEEAPALGRPVLVFREVTERVDGVEHHAARVVGREREGVVKEVARLLEDEHAYREMARPRDLYGDGRAAERIVGGLLHHFGLGERPEPFRSPSGPEAAGGPA